MSYWTSPGAALACYRCFYWLITMVNIFRLLQMFTCTLVVIIHSNIKRYSVYWLTPIQWTMSNVAFIHTYFKINALDSIYRGLVINIWGSHKVRFRCFLHPVWHSVHGSALLFVSRQGSVWEFKQLWEGGRSSINKCCTLMYKQIHHTQRLR